MNPLVLKRLRNEEYILQQNITRDFFLQRVPEQHYFEGFIRGPENSLYAEAVFRIRVVIPQDFPMIAPKIYFVDSIFHPNVNFETGEVCVDLLKENWNPTMTLYSLVIVLQYFMQEPNPQSPLNIDAAYFYQQSKREYEKMARYFASYYIC